MGVSRRLFGVFEPQFRIDLVSNHFRECVDVNVARRADVQDLPVGATAVINIRFIETTSST